jgi:predicted permease
MNWFRRLFARDRIYRDLSEEIRQHLDEKVDALMQAGMSREEATARARREFGNVAAVEERGREVWQWPSLESILFDVRYAFRQLRRQPSFAFVAILILGLGIGANTAVYSVIDKLFLEPLPFHAPDRLVSLLRSDGRGRTSRFWTVDAYETLRDMQVFEELTTYEAYFARSSYKLTGDGDPDRVAGVLIPANFFPFLSVSPQLGRTFTESECKLNGPGAVILSHGLWERRYSSDPGVIGRQVIVNDRAATIVGVMPAAFDFGAVFAPGIRIELYMPAVFDTLREWGTTMAVVGRHRPGVTAAATRAEVNAILDRQERERSNAGTPSRFGVVLQPLRESIVGNMQRPMLTLWAAVGLVQLIVCINLANLLLARGVTRRKEMALRSAIGAGRFRLVRQLVSESLVLSGLGGALGVAFASVAVLYLRRLEGLSIPLLKSAEINGAALGVAIAVTVLTALLFGLVPAMTSARSDFGEALKATSRGSSEGREHRFVRSLLVVSEVGLACLLLVCTGLLLRSFLRVLDLNLGFRPEQAYALRVDAGPGMDTPEKFHAYMKRLISAARDVPGVEAASITDAVPLDSSRNWAVRAKGQPPDQTIGALVKIVGPGLMETMRTPIIAGREFTDQDAVDSLQVTMINQALAERLWPGQDPLRRPMMVNVDRELLVVGVVANIRHVSVEEAPRPEFYLPILQRTTMSPSLVVRTERPFAEVAPALRRALAEIAGDLPTTTFRPLQQIVDRAVSSRRFFVELLIAFASAGLALAAIGIYGVISYSVSQRTPEIGIRMALGASSARIRAEVVRDTVRLALLGAVLGTAGAIAISSVLASLLFGVSPTDPWTYGGAVAVLLLVAITAGIIPAVRASRISPMTALRAD